MCYGECEGLIDITDEYEITDNNQDIIQEIEDRIKRRKRIGLTCSAADHEENIKIKELQWVLSLLQGKGE